jgi:hypothetical protein
LGNPLKRVTTNNPLRGEPTMPTADYLRLMLAAYLLTVAVETAVLLVALSRRHSIRARLFAGAWLTACTYPVVWLVLPPLIEERWLYLLVAETFAPVTECALFWFAFVRGRDPDRRSTKRDFVAVVLANLASFGLGELLRELGLL